MSSLQSLLKWERAKLMLSYHFPALPDAWPLVMDAWMVAVLQAPPVALASTHTAAKVPHVFNGHDYGTTMAYFRTLQVHLDEYGHAQVDARVCMQWLQRLDEEPSHFVAAWCDATCSDVGQQRQEKALTRRERTSLLNILGAMTELLLNPRPGRDSNAAVIRELVSNYGDKPGIAESTLEGKLAEARRSLLTG